MSMNQIYMAVGAAILLAVAIVLIHIKIRGLVNDRQKKRAGLKGEKNLGLQIRKILKKSDGVILRNVVLPLYDTTTEIDLLVICSRGILVIENKHYSGEIQGDTHKKRWMQIRPNGERHEFYSPIMQNEGHIKCLKHHLRKNKLNDLKISSMITFSCDNVQLNVDDRRVKYVDEGLNWIENSFLRGKISRRWKFASDTIKRASIDYIEM